MLDSQTTHSEQYKVPALGVVGPNHHSKQIYHP